MLHRGMKPLHNTKVTEFGKINKHLLCGMDCFLVINGCTQQIFIECKSYKISSGCWRYNSEQSR